MQHCSCSPSVTVSAAGPKHSVDCLYRYAAYGLGSLGIVLTVLCRKAFMARRLANNLIVADVCYTSATV